MLDDEDVLKYRSIEVLELPGPEKKIAIIVTFDDQYKENKRYTFDAEIKEAKDYIKQVCNSDKATKSLKNKKNIKKIISKLATK